MQNVLTAGLPAALIAAALLLPAQVAQADCTAEMAAVAAKLPGVTDPRTQKLVAYDLKRAAKELGEGDPDECLEAMEHARSLLEPAQP